MTNDGDLEEVRHVEDRFAYPYYCIREKDGGAVWGLGGGEYADDPESEAWEDAWDNMKEQLGPSNVDMTRLECVRVSACVAGYIERTGETGPLVIVDGEGRHAGESPAPVFLMDSEEHLGRRHVYFIQGWPNPELV